MFLRVAFGALAALALATAGLPGAAPAASLSLARMPTMSCTQQYGQLVCTQPFDVAETPSAASAENAQTLRKIKTTLAELRLSIRELRSDVRSLTAQMRRLYTPWSPVPSPWPWGFNPAFPTLSSEDPLSALEMGQRNGSVLINSSVPKVDSRSQPHGVDGADPSEPEPKRTATVTVISVPHYGDVKLQAPQEGYPIDHVLVRDFAPGPLPVEQPTQEGYPIDHILERDFAPGPLPVQQPTQAGGVQTTAGEPADSALLKRWDIIKDRLVAENPVEQLTQAGGVQATAGEPADSTILKRWDITKHRLVAANETQSTPEDVASNVVISAYSAPPRTQQEQLRLMREMQQQQMAREAAAEAAAETSSEATPTTTATPVPSRQSDPRYW